MFIYYINKHMYKLQYIYKNYLLPNTMDIIHSAYTYCHTPD